MATKVLSKRVQISKDMATQVAVLAAASFVTMFCLVASKTLLQQQAYQSKVIGRKELAKKQLDANVNAVQSLVTKYKAFENTNDNFLKGNPAGQGELDGDNARLVLDALPSKYDYPALSSSIEKLLTGYKIEVITGVDDELAQSSTNNPSTTSVTMPITMGYSVPLSDYQHGVDFISQLERSIRPFKVTQLGVTASDKELHFVVSADTYYLPTKSLNIKKEVVK